jgi:hypothetical protein
LIYKVFFVQKYIKVIFFIFKKLFLILTHKKLKTIKNNKFKVKKKIKKKSIKKILLKYKNNPARVMFFRVYHLKFTTYHKLVHIELAQASHAKKRKTQSHVYKLSIVVRLTAEKGFMFCLPFSLLGGCRFVSLSKFKQSSFLRNKTSENVSTFRSQHFFKIKMASGVLEYWSLK